MVKITLKKNKIVTALVWQEDRLFVAKSLEIELASQGKTRKQALANLQEALELYFEDEPEKLKIPEYKNLSVEKLNLMHA